MRIRDILRETGPQKLFYHGTDYHNAVAILKSGGTNPYPEWKNYGDDAEDLESLYGTYFTDNLAGAIKYAWKVAMQGDQVMAIIAANLDLTQALPDEDTLHIAMYSAEKAKNADQFVEQFHYALTGHRDIEMPDRKLLVALRNAYLGFRKSFEAEPYRQALDKVAHAYAAAALTPHPIYLGGQHTVRMPHGIPASSIVSVTTFNLNEDLDVENVSALKGVAIDPDDLQSIVYELAAEDAFE